MARSPFTLAASVTSALPRVGVVGVGALTEGAAGRYDAAIADLDDGRRVVVRVPADDTAVPELAAEVRALRALTPGVRGLLPFRAPELLGEAGIGDSRAIVVDFLPGYRVDAAHLPPGRGAATSLGASLAALHALPLSIVRTEGLPVRTPQQVRTDTARLIDRAEATRRTPKALLGRWRRAVASDELWRFESAVVLGGAGAASFLFDDVDGVPRVTGLLEWHGLSVGDPAADLQWLASAPAAADDVYAAYVAHSGRAPDARARERGRLYAELEFAKWLIHGHESGRKDVIDDAVGLLESLAAGVQGDDIVTDAALDVEDAIALLERMPGAAPVAVDTSMQTDAYDPEELSLWVASDDDSPGDDDADDAGAVTEDLSAIRQARLAAAAADSGEMGAGPRHVDDLSTAPIELPTLLDVQPRDVDEEREAERASRAAFQRWTRSDSE
ncbi:phosphotransferase [Microbacterium pumilum]|uniref:Aminoglycoside phosphotransferase domain-containing protein n=1 Tax=Microbacterium pumilum TaxID=344165 RepID=A0ABP5E964_9MICO